MSGLPDHCKLCNATRPPATAAPAAAPSQQGSGRRTCSWRFACTRGTHLQVECDVERVPDGNEGEGDHRGGGLSTHHLGEGAAGSMWSEDAWSTGGQRQEQRWAESGSCGITRNRTLRCPGSVAPLLVDACALQPGRQPPQERRAAAYKGRPVSACSPLGAAAPASQPTFKTGTDRQRLTSPGGPAAAPRPRLPPRRPLRAAGPWQLLHAAPGAGPPATTTAAPPASRATGSAWHLGLPAGGLAAAMHSIQVSDVPGAAPAGAGRREERPPGRRGPAERWWLPRTAWLLQWVGTGAIKRPKGFACSRAGRGQHAIHFHFSVLACPAGPAVAVGSWFKHHGRPIRSRACRAGGGDGGGNVAQGGLPDSPPSCAHPAAHLFLQTLGG